MKNILVLIFFVLALSGCKKEYDYRDKFLGNYYFIVHLRTATGLPPSSSTDTIYNYHGKIEYGSTANSVLILFSEPSSSTYSSTPVIYEEGTFQYYYGPHGYMEGEFESTENVKFNFGWGSPGSSIRYEITGEKE